MPYSVLEHVRRVEAVLAARAGHDTVVRAVVPAITVAELMQLPLPLRPIDGKSFLFRQLAGIADAGIAERDGRLATLCCMRIFDCRIGALIGNDALRTEMHILRQSILRFRTSFPRELDITDLSANGELFHCDNPVSSMLSMHEIRLNIDVHRAIYGMGFTIVPLQTKACSLRNTSPALRRWHR